MSNVNAKLPQNSFKNRYFQAIKSAIEELYEMETQNNEASKSIWNKIEGFVQTTGPILAQIATVLAQNTTITFSYHV